MNSRIISLVALPSLFLALASFAHAGETPIALEGSTIKVELGGSVLRVTEKTPSRITLKGHVRDTGVSCTKYQTYERSYIGCSTPESNPDPNPCVTTFQECVESDFYEYGREKKFVLRFKGKIPRANTEIRLVAAGSDGFEVSPQVTSTDPCLKFEIRAKTLFIPRRSPTIVVRNTCSNE